MSVFTRHNVFFGIIFSLFLFIVLTADRHDSFAVSADPDPPVLSNIHVVEVGTSTALIRWTTDEGAEGMVNYGLDRKFGIERSLIPNKKNHEILVTDLDAATTYYFRTISLDEAGNQSISDDFTFKTESTVSSPALEKILSAEQRELAEKALEILGKIKDPRALEIIVARANELAGELGEHPQIIGSPTVKEIGSDFAVISWKTDREADSIVYFADERAYAPDSDDPYPESQGDPDERVIEHGVRIIGLAPATKYHFSVSSKGEIGGRGFSEDGEFQTKATLPEILGVSLQKVEADAATIAMSTNIPTSIIVEYTNTRTGEKKLKGDPTFLTTHTVRLTDLSFAAPYTAVVKVENEIGDKFTSDPLSFFTVRDDAPPVISKVTNESTLFPGEDVKIQTIVGWDTDEPALCQFFFHSGLAADERSTESTPPEGDPTQKHVQVLTSLLSSSVYKFWIECSDRTGNPSRSEDFVLITPEKEKSIIDIIIENFSGTFGWLKNIGK